MAIPRIPRRTTAAIAGLGIFSLLGLGLTGCAPGEPGREGGTTATTSTPEPTPSGRRLGAEWEPHARTVMSWPTSQIWAEDTDDVRDDIATLARAIAAYEPVTMMASPEDAKEAARACGPEVGILPIPVDDLWARDTVPVPVEDADGLVGIDLNFNGWGGKQNHERDAGVAEAFLADSNLPRTKARLISEGGSFETDGQGTLLVTESSIVNENRNPGWTRDAIEAELRELFGVTTVIWFDGVRGEDITDAHVDSLVRFASPGVVLLDTPGPGAPADVWSQSSAQARAVLSAATDANGRPFKIIELPQPDFSRIRGDGDEFLASYVNFTVTNGAVFVPEFGDRRADRHAQKILGEQFPGRMIVPIRIDTIASGGGGIHCATRDIPKIAG